MTHRKLAVKICCMRNERELALAAAAGADFVGLVGPMPSGPGVLSLERAGELAAQMPGDVTAVLLTSGTDPEVIVAQVRATGVGAVQLVRHHSPAVRAALRRALPDVILMQVLHVEGREALRAVREMTELADVLLLDSGRPAGGAPELGGTGRRHDWEVSAEIVRRSTIPVMLAGGLTPESVAEAVGRVRPWGVDVCSGLRDAEGALLPHLLHDFVRSARRCGRRENPHRPPK
ncbi:MAG: phosphoribosylanthranilate isomerase [Gemmatimonadota bacterium]